MRIDPEVGNFVVAGHSRDANYMSPARSLVSFEGSNAGQSPQFAIEYVHSFQGVSPRHDQLSNDQQAIDLNDELSELAKKSRTVLDSIIAEKNRAVEEKQAHGNRLASIEEKMAKLVDKKNTLAVEKDRLGAGTAQKEALISKLETANVELERDNSKLVEQNTQLVLGNAKLVEDKAHLSDEINDHKNTTRRLQDIIIQMRTGLLAKCNENEQLKQESRLKDGEIGQLKFENQEKLRMLQEEKVLSQLYVQRSEEQAEMLRKCIKKKDGQIAIMKREMDELADELDGEVELRRVQNAEKEKKKNAVLKTILPDQELKQWNEFKRISGRKQKREQNRRVNVGAEMPGTAGHKRKATGGPHATNSKMGRNEPNIRGNGATRN